MAQGLLDRRIAETPIAIVDFETTGLSPGQDRVVEVSVVRLDPGQQPRQVLDTLVSPQRSVTATEIHGLTDADVAGAPAFTELTADLLMAISGCVVAAYNASSELSFLYYELSHVGLQGVPPYVCLMNLQPLLGLGNKCALSAACQRFGIPFADRHHAVEATWAGAQLMQRYLARMNEQGILTFGQLRDRQGYKFLDSLERTPPQWSLVTGNFRPKRRVVKPQTVGAPTKNPAAYWDALVAAVSDLQISADEIAQLTDLRKKLDLSNDQIRMFHARMFAAVLRQFIEDQQVDAQEAKKLQMLAGCLRKLGWAPGD